MTFNLWIMLQNVRSPCKIGSDTAENGPRRQIVYFIISEFGREILTRFFKFGKCCGHAGGRWTSMSCTQLYAIIHRVDVLYQICGSAKSAKVTREVLALPLTLRGLNPAEDRAGLLRSLRLTTVWACCRSSRQIRESRSTSNSRSPPAGKNGTHAPILHAWKIDMIDAPQKIQYEFLASSAKTAMQEEANTEKESTVELQRIEANAAP